MRRREDSTALRERRQRNIANGICGSCGCRPLSSTYHCEVCLERNRIHMQKVVAARIAAGKCQLCNKPTRAGKSTCGGHRKACRRASLKFYYKRLAAGVCAYCGNGPLKTKTLCAKHAAMMAARVRVLYRERNSAGLCGRCGKGPLETTTMCAKCAAADRRRSRKQYRRLQETSQ